jgi:hypothetical protein
VSPAWRSCCSDWETVGEFTDSNDWRARNCGRGRAGFADGGADWNWLHWQPEKGNLGSFWMHAVGPIFAGWATQLVAVRTAGECSCVLCWEEGPR